MFIAWVGAKYAWTCGQCIDGYAPEGPGSYRTILCPNCLQEENRLRRGRAALIDQDTGGNRSWHPK